MFWTGPLKIGNDVVEYSRTTSYPPGSALYEARRESDSSTVTTADVWIVRKSDGWHRAMIRSSAIPWHQIGEWFTESDAFFAAISVLQSRHE